MPIREVLKMGEASLLRTAKLVPIHTITSPEIQSIITDLFDTMHATNGAGLAAPQIGVDLQIVVFGFEKNIRYPEAPPIPQTVLINPEITVLDNTEFEDWEGCLSVPGLRGKVPRYRKVQYEGWNQNGEKIDRIAEDFHARVVQHECDHLFGKLFPMRIRDFTQFGFTSVLFPELESSKPH
jgi:peptide deformylase